MQRFMNILLALLRYFAPVIISCLLRLLDGRLTAKDLLEVITEASEKSSNNFSRRGIAHKALKERLGEDSPENTINLAIELGVLLLKLRNNNK